jgi:hypothetical protein
MSNIGRSAIATHVVAEEAVIARREKQEIFKNKVNRQVGVDRLKNDKDYLFLLTKQITERTDVSNDRVHKQVLKEAEEVLQFLKQRDMFWDQLQHK